MSDESIIEDAENADKAERKFKRKVLDGLVEVDE
jgi:hypothetical protein